MRVSRERARRGLNLAERIYPILRGQEPDLVGAALADVVALWIAGHAPDLREEMFRQWIRTTRQLTELAAQKALDSGWHPSEWRKQ